MKKNYFLLLFSLLIGVTMQAQVTYSGNGNSGFGGVIGTGNLQLSDDGTTVSITFTTGGGSFNDKLVIYIDSETGGFTDTSGFTDTGDPLRQAISGFDGTNRSTVNFPSGFSADHVIALDSGFAGLWDLTNGGSHTFISSANLSGTGPYTVDATFANLGSPSGNRFKFVATYLNHSGSFRSDEAVGDGIAGGNPGATAVTFTVPKSYPNNTWTGTTDSDWSTATNWEGGVPESTHSVIIPSGLTNYPTALSAVTINSGTIESGATLIAQDDFTGNVTYNRTLNFVSGNTNGWHLVSSPVAGEIFDNTFATNNDIASGSSTNLGVASYNTTGNTWTYLQSPSGSISSTSGMGYSMKRASTGTVSFTGTINTGDVNGVTVGTADGGFNLLGNPYTAYMSSQTFLNANTNTTGQIWTWTDGGGYTARTAADNFIIAPGQGFFVSVASGSTVDFAESNQTSGTDNFQKTNKTEISLFIANGKVNRSARLMYFDDNVTKGFDWGYEGKTFTGVKTNMEVFTHILENNIGENYQVQSLPKKDMESMVIPVGITADAGKITFTAKAMNLPNGLKVFLEDRENNTFTRLDETNASYAVTLTEKTDGVGRFYLHTKSSSVLSTDAFTLNTISMYPTNSNNLRIVGLSQGKSQIKLFTILGKQVVNKSFTANGVYNVQLPNLTTGVYIAQLENESGQISKKIVLE